MIIKKQIKKPEQSQTQELEKHVPEPQPAKEEEIDLFDLDNIDFSQRQERRRGDRRRGYRRIDDRNLISRAQEEADTIKESAAKEGYRAGIEQAAADIEELKGSLKNFLSAKQEVFDYIAPDILEISIDIARKIVKKEIEQDPEIVMNTISDVLQTISKDEPKISVKVNSSQVTFVRERLPDVISKTGIDARISIVPDDTIEEGSCIVYTSNGIVDATIKTQLEIISEALKEL